MSEDNTKTTGFPSPAEEYREGSLSLDKHLIKNPSATFFVTMEGNSMLPLILPGDILMIDRSLNPQADSLVVGHHNDEFIVRKIQQVKENPDFVLFGVVAWIIHKTH